MARCSNLPPVVEPVLRPRVASRPHGSPFFRFLRGTAIFTFLLIVSIVGLTQWRDIEVSRHEAELKREMISRGMSAQEIEAVLRAKPQAESSRKRPSLSESELARHREVESQLIRDLTTLDCRAQDIELIVTAFSTHLGSGSGRTAKQAAKDAEFVRSMVRWGKPASEVEQIIRLQARSRGDGTSNAPVPVRTANRDPRREVEEALKTLLKSGWTPDELHQVMQQIAFR
ncbi:MAG: hypothetical protein NZM31_08500 [Gemmatales bacterium]|nr:hypothetical protein [Gemmatales bacterium]MDW8387031.1 hypothetical protein [Gemmatales bacterium]